MAARAVRATYRIPKRPPKYRMASEAVQPRASVSHAVPGRTTVAMLLLDVFIRLCRGMAVHDERAALATLGVFI